MRELLFSITKKDLKIEFFSGKGAGGQKRNKCQNCVRMTHPESGSRATGQSAKERSSNLREAFKGLTSSAKFKLWIAIKIDEIKEGKTLKQQVEKMMCPENLKIEFKNTEGRWVECNERA